MICGNKIVHMVGGMNNKVNMPSSLAGYEVVLFVWMYIKIPAKVVIMKIRG